MVELVERGEVESVFQESLERIHVNEYGAWSASLGGADNACHFKLIHDFAGTRVTNVEFAL